MCWYYNIVTLWLFVDPIGDTDILLPSIIISDAYLILYYYASGPPENRKWVHRFYYRLESRYIIVYVGY